MKTIKQLLTTIVVLLCSIVAHAYDFEVDGIYYNIISASDLTVGVTFGENKYSGEVIIPSSITYQSRTLDVVSIQRSAFYECHELTSVTIPNSITNIESWAFEYSKLESVTIPNSVINIGDRAFPESLKNLHIEDGTSTLTMGYGYNIFPPHGLFTNCLLENVYLGRNLNYKTGETYGYSPFYRLSTLKSVTIGKYVTEIGDAIFYECSNLKEIHINDLVAWCNIESETNILYSRNLYLNGELITDLVIPDEVTRLKNQFYGCNSLTSVTIPNSVKYIEEGGFGSCKNLTSVTIGNGIISIEDDAFRGCLAIKKVNLNCQLIENWFTDHYTYAPDENTSLKTVILGNNVKYIGESAFFKCSGLTSITLGKNIEHIGDKAFSGCTGLTSIYLFNTTPPLIGESNFTDSHYLKTSIYVPQGTLARYQSADIWRNFWNIQEVEIHKITYLVDGEIYAIDSIIYGQQIKLPKDPISPKEGYTFSGWKIEGFEKIPKTMPNEDIVIFGHFTNTYAIYYIVSDQVYATDSITYGDTIRLLEEPKKEGYTFSGWSEAPETMPANDITITGSFSINTYAITYLIDDEVFAIDSLTYGSKIVLRDEPQKEGYTFSGWSEAPETMPANDVTITGSFSINTYAITYLIDGEVFAIDSLTYGSKIILRDKPKKNGYAFSGWSEAPETMPANDITITGYFNATAIQNITIDAINIEIKDNSIILHGINNSTITIYTINGVLVKSIDNYAGEEIALDKGIYIVCIGNESIKIKI